MTLNEPTVSSALEVLRDRNLVYVYYGSNARVPKYKHMLPSVYELAPDETAVVAVLMLRGAQTVGELRERTSRMHQFAGLGDVQAVLDKLAHREEPIVAKLERVPGQKDARYAHLLSGDAPAPIVTSRAEAAAPSGVEGEIASLRKRVDDLEAKFEEFRKQFE